jgi:hypothetical protein
MCLQTTVIVLSAPICTKAFGVNAVSAATALVLRPRGM